MKNITPAIFGSARWISFYPEGRAAWHPESMPSPVFRKKFAVECTAQSTRLVIAGLGLFEVRINGRNVSDAVLQPTWAAFDKRYSYCTFDVGNYLHPGENVIDVMLGNGMFNCQSRETWNFYQAPWRDYPKLLCALYINERSAVVSDTSWQWAFGPIVFDSWRGGEIYDARREELLNDPDNWSSAVPSASPGGVGVEDFAPPCRVIKRMTLESSNNIIYHAPYNMSGWARITVEGDPGAEVELEFGESVSDDGSSVDNRGLARYVTDGTFQLDKYILKGVGREVYEPRFTVHGFCVFSLKTTGKVKVLKVEVCEVRQDFAAISRVESASCSDLPAVLQMAERTLLANSVHLPTDCPQREKNGWSADAALMAELALYKFDCAEFFAAFVQRLGDTQRADGHISCIAPSAGWGYNWGSGPAWDMALYRIPCRIALHTGNPAILHEMWPFMLKNLDFYRSIEDNGLIHNGLSDWYPPDDLPAADRDLVRTAFYINMYNDLEKSAVMLDRLPEIKDYLEHGAELKKVFNEHFAPEKLTHPTEIALSVLFDIAPAVQHAALSARLAEKVRQARGTVFAGMHGMWATAMVLGQFGYTDELMMIYTADEFPSFGYWRKTLNATTFWESFSDKLDFLSRNHGAFAGGLRAFYEYTAGFRHDWQQPGKNLLHIQPAFPQQLDDLNVEYINYRLKWSRNGSKIELELTVPEKCRAILTLPGASARQLDAGCWKYSLNNNKQPYNTK